MLLKKLRLIRNPPRWARYDYIKTFDAEEVNYEKLGFHREVGGRLVYAGSYVDGSTLAQLQTHYALAAPLETPLLKLLGAAQSLEEVKFLLMRNRAEFLEFNRNQRHHFIVNLGCRFGEEVLTLGEYSSSLVAQCNELKPSELADTVAVSTSLGFEVGSGLRSQLDTAVHYHLNDLGLFDSAKLSVFTQSSTIQALLQARLGVLIQRLLHNDSGGNMELIKKLPEWSLVDYCLLLMSSINISGHSRLKDLLPYLLYQQVLEKKHSTALESSIFMQILKTLSCEDDELLAAGILSVEYFNGSSDYQTILDERPDFTEWINELYETLPSSPNSIGAVYAALRGEDLDQVNAVLHPRNHKPDIFLPDC